MTIPEHRSPSDPYGTWTIDPATSTVCFAWRAMGLWTVTGRRQCLGVIHLDELPPAGVIRFEQPSNLPVLTMALDPSSLGTGETDRRQRWWTLHSQSLEILPSGAWRVMATLTTYRTLGLVELRMEADPKASGRDRLVLRGRSVLDRRAFAAGNRSSLDPTIRLELAIHARRVPIHPTTKRNEGEAIDGRGGAAARIIRSAE
jgi:hypothetical protein